MGIWPSGRWERCGKVVISMAETEIILSRLKSLEDKVDNLYALIEKALVLPRGSGEDLTKEPSPKTLREPLKSPPRSPAKDSRQNTINGVQCRFCIAYGGPCEHHVKYYDAERRAIVAAAAATAVATAAATPVDGLLPGLDLRAATAFSTPSI